MEQIALQVEQEPAGRPRIWGALGSPPSTSPSRPRGRSSPPTMVVSIHPDMELFHAPCPSRTARGCLSSWLMSRAWVAWLTKPLLLQVQQQGPACLGEPKAFGKGVNPGAQDTAPTKLDLITEAACTGPPRSWVDQLTIYGARPATQSTHISTPPTQRGTSNTTTRQDLDVLTYMKSRPVGAVEPFGAEALSRARWAGVTVTRARWAAEAVTRGPGGRR